MTDHSRFQQFVAHQPKRKRAGVACVACHDRKIKCDLEGLIAQGYNTCTNCATAGIECQSRPLNRDKRSRISKRASSPRNGERELPPQKTPREAVADHRSHISTPPLSTELNTGTSDHVLEASAVIDVDDDFSAFANGNLYQSHESAPRIIDIPVGNSFREQQGAIFPIQHNDPSTADTRTDPADSYLGETGFLEIYGPETQLDADGQLQHNQRKHETMDLPPSELQQSFIETYFEFCYTWCPVLERDTLPDELAQSPLLQNALAVAGSHVQPPRIFCAGPALYYDRVKQMFYGDKEQDLMMCLKAITLIYWWSPRAPSRVHRDASWWWTTVAIRHAQHGGFHREPKPGYPSRSTISPGLRRRIWWTLFARERLTALCQDRPCVIDPEDCDVCELSLDDFTVKDEKAEIFIFWVRLCAIIGRVAKYLSRSTTTSSSPFPVHLAKELIEWVQSLPDHLALPIRSDRTTKFNRDIHQLHLPYLSVIIVLHLSRRSSQPLPQAYPAAILAASCIARILKDCLARGRIRYMMAISCWYCGISLLPLLQARHIEHLAEAADEDIKIVLIALEELRVMWPTANIFIQGFKRLRTSSAAAAAADGENISINTRGPTRADPSSNMEDISSSNGIDWTQYFPHATMQTSGLANKLLPEYQDELLIDDSWLGFMMLHPSELFDPLDNYAEPMPILPVL